jgi:glucokinase
MSKYCIGVDLGGTNIKFALFDKGMQSAGALEAPTPGAQGPDGVIAAIVAGCDRLIRQEKLAKSDIVGVGIGSPGPLDIANGIVLDMPNIGGFKNVHLRDRVGAGLGLPAALDNDANVAGYGEYLCGGGKGARVMVFLTLGTGIGSGIVIDGHVFRGAHGIGAELGHMIVEPGGELCGCGQQGCMEHYSSAHYLAQYARRAVEESNRKGLLKGVLEKAGKITARDVAEARAQGDELACVVWDRAIHYLAVGCVNIARIFDPERIVLGGGMAKAGKDLIEPVRQEFQRLHWNLTDPRTELFLATLGNDAGVVGAAGVAWDELGPK